MSKQSKTPETPEADVQFSGVYVFAKPIEFEGQRYEQVSYDLEALTPQDVITAKKEAARLRGTEATSLLTDETLHVVLFARAADMPAGFALALSVRDFAAWAIVGQLFFASAVSDLIS